MKLTLFAPPQYRWRLKRLCIVLPVVALMCGGLLTLTPGEPLSGWPAGAAYVVVSLALTGWALTKPRR